MDSKGIIGTLYDYLVQFVPLFRVFWIITVLIGAALVVTAIILKKSPERKKAPWIVGSIGIVMMISSSVQLLTSLI